MASRKDKIIAAVASAEAPCHLEAARLFGVILSDQNIQYLCQHDCLLESCRSEVSPHDPHQYIYLIITIISHLSYVQYSTIAARAVRQALRGDAKEAATKRGETISH